MVELLDVGNKNHLLRGGALLDWCKGNA